MPRKPPVVFPQEQRLLSELGERLRLARKRRKLSNAVVAQRAGVSRTTVYKVEAGDPGATLGAYVRVLAVLGLEGDLNLLAADDRIGRKLQDLALARIFHERDAVASVRAAQGPSGARRFDPRCFCTGGPIAGAPPPSPVVDQHAGDSARPALRGQRLRSTGEDLAHRVT